MSAKNFNYALKFPQNEGFYPEFYTVGQKFPNKKIFQQFSDSQKLYIVSCLPCHNATGFHFQFFYFDFASAVLPFCPFTLSKFLAISSGLSLSGLNWLLVNIVCIGQSIKSPEYLFVRACVHASNIS